MPTDDIAKLLPNFLFILLRAGIVLTMLPFFSSRNFPAKFRIGIAVAISFVLTPIVDFHLAQASIPAIVIREIMFGIALGLAVRFIFFAVDMAGHIMSSATGMSAASTFNPEMGPSTDISQILSIFATLIFFATDTHHDVIAVFVKSYELLPAGTVNVEGLVSTAMSLAGKTFIIALKISAPIVIIMLITHILLGFIYKAVPQMNIFFVGQPVYIFIGLLTMMLSLPVLAHVMGGYFSGIKDEMGRVMFLMKG